MQAKANNTYDRESYILIVDDDDTLLKFFKIHLNKFFSKVIVVRNAKEAVDMIKEKVIDLVISDIRMPRTDGFQLFRKIKRIDSKIPVMLISGAMLSDEQLESVGQVDGFIKKPFSVDELHSLIEFGLKKRESLKALGEIIADNDELREVLKGRSKPKRYVKEPEHLEKANELLDNLQRKAS